jgi:hypothetical protein
LFLTIATAGCRGVVEQKGFPTAAAVTRAEPCTVFPETKAGVGSCEEDFLTEFKNSYRSLFQSERRIKSQGNIHFEEKFHKPLFLIAYKASKLHLKNQEYNEMPNCVRIVSPPNKWMSDT